MLFHDGRVKLVELHQKKFISNCEKISYECQNFVPIRLMCENSGISNIFTRVDSPDRKEKLVLPKILSKRLIAFLAFCKFHLRYHFGVGRIG